MLREHGEVSQKAAAQVSIIDNGPDSVRKHLQNVPSRRSRRSRAARRLADDQMRRNGCP